MLPAAKYLCDQCDDTGLVKVTGRYPDGRSVDLGIQPCKHCEMGRQEAEHRMDARLKTAGMPDDYRTFTFASFDALPDSVKRGKLLAKAASQVFVEMRGKPFAASQIYQRLGFSSTLMQKRFGLVFTGAYGVGKTGMAATIANELTALRESVMFITTKVFLKDVQKGYGDPAFKGVLETVMNAPFLVLDECNLLDYTSNKKEIMEMVIDHRNSNLLPYVLTTNLSQEEFEACWGAFIAARVNHNCHWIPVSGEVMRDEGQMLVDPTLPRGEQ